MFAEVAVALPVRGRFHYKVDVAVGIGSRVLVPFSGRMVTGVVVGLDAAPPAGISPEGCKRLGRLLDREPALDAGLLELCRWVADYYEAPLGEVLRAALPPGTQVTGAMTLAITEAGRAALAGGGGAMPVSWRRGLEGLGSAAAPGLPALELPAPVRRALLGAELVTEGHAESASRVKPRLVTTITLAASCDDVARAALVRAPRRFGLVEKLRAAGGTLDRAALVGGDPSAQTALRALVAAGLVLAGQREAGRDFEAPHALGTSAPVEALPPTKDQGSALASLELAIESGTFSATLLHGITGSGKTEVYLQAIARVLARGRGALVLVPEIALTPQLAHRFRARFGDRVAVLHSGLSDSERFEHWRRLKAGVARIAVGARSAVFAPVPDLGIIVVDEEHDASFKQEEGVRYQGRDVAILRAQKAGVPCVLGSATPSMETYAHARAGRYTLCELAERPTQHPLPEVELVDLRTYRPDGESLLSAPLGKAIEETLARGEQVILFLNRRGFATFVLCVACGKAFRCPACSVSLTYHREDESLRCHYCGHGEHFPIGCSKCGAAESVRRLGIGTERVAAAITQKFPAARVARLDRDTTSGGRGPEKILHQVASREVDILVGTQMVTKGHDFPGVTLVGVLCADTGMNLPDFRASERTFQLLTQVAGRAGRGGQAGRVIVQTYSPEHPAVVHARSHDYPAFFAAEEKVREELGYPPSGRLIAIRVDGPSPHHVQALADELGARALTLGAAARGVSVMGPAEAPLARLRGRSRWHVWLRSPDRHALRAFVRALVKDAIVEHGLRLTVDVDPVSAL
jgi:primosomal protein N' (replication factor Y)